MNILKFRHEQPRNSGYINKDVVRCNFKRFAKEKNVYREKKYNLDTMETAIILRYNLDS